MRNVLMKPTEADRKLFHCEFKSVDSNSRRIKGFASTRFKDRANDIVEPGAFKSAMELYMKNPILLYQHDMTKPVGKVADYEIIQDGLFIYGDVAKGTVPADEAWTLIAQDILKAFSIGFYSLDSSYDKALDAVVIHKIELIEISIVSIPANRESLFSIAKAFRDGTDLINSTKPDQAMVAILEIRKQLTYLSNVYALLKPEMKIEIDALKFELDNMYNLDERSKLLSEVTNLSKEILIEASLRGGLSDSGKSI